MLLQFLFSRGFSETRNLGAPGSLAVNMDEGLGTINDGSDICIRCAPYDFRVHKAVVYPQSGVFAFAFDGEFPVSLTVRRNSNITFDINRKERLIKSS